MKTRKRLAAATLLVSMLLSLFGGGFPSAAAAQTATTVTTDRELAYDPLAQTASIAYEQHEEGYTVSLDRSEDSVTMKITAAPDSESSRAPQNARLYVHTGVTLKPGTAYRVGFSLWAEQAQPEYAVRFDGGARESAYGTLDGRSVNAGGTDKVQYQVTPGTANGELVLCLLLGKTGGNTFRLSNLAVEEAPGNVSGRNAILVDELNYNAPGFIRCWTHTDRAASVTCDETSATLKVTKGPLKDAEIWKIKLFVATGFKPAAGKTYHLTANVSSTAKESFELCYNEDDTEKGFGAEYSQRLTGQNQTLDYMIRIPKDKTDPGELILQFSLGKLKTGDAVTVSNVRIEEARPSYTSVLSDDFAFNEQNTSIAAIEPVTRVTSVADAHPEINWESKAAVTKSGDKAGELIVSGDGAALEIYGGENLWDARLNIDTGAELTAGAAYRVSFNIQAEYPYSEYEVLYGTALNGVDNNQAYGARKGLSLAANTLTAIEYIFTPEADGGLLISLQAGKTGGKYNAVTVSGFKIEKVVSGQPSETDIADVNYPDSSPSSADSSETFRVKKARSGQSLASRMNLTAERAVSVQYSNGSSFSVRDGHGSITGDGSSVTMTCEDVDNKWEKGLFVDSLCNLEAGKNYQVSFDIQTDGQEFTYNVCYNRDAHFGDGNEKGFGEKRDLTVSSAKSTVTQIAAAADGKGGKLFMFLEFAGADTGTKVTVSNIQVHKLEGTPAGDNLASPVDYSKFTARDNKGTIVSDSNSATLTCAAPESDPAAWQRGIFTGDICELSAGTSYQASFDITATAETPFEVCYNKDEDWGNGEGAFGKEFDLTASTELSTVTHTITPAENGKLRLRIDLGLAKENTEVTVSSIQVHKLEERPVGDNLAEVTYPGDDNPDPGPGPDPEPNTGSFDVRANGSYTGSITGDGRSATMTCTGGDAGEAWKRGMFTGEVARLSAGKSYQVSFKVTADNSTPFEVCYNKNEDWGAGEKGFGGEYGLTADSAPLTVTHTVTTDTDSTLRLRIDLGRAAEGTNVTISDIQVREIGYAPVPGSEELITAFGSVSSEGIEGYTADLTRNPDSAVLKVTKPSTDATGWKAKLFIRTGIVYNPNKNYRAQFDITAENAVNEFCVISQGVPDSEDIRGTWALTIGEGETKTITTRPVPGTMGSGELVLQLELGNFEGTENTFTVSGVKVEEVGLSVSSEYDARLAFNGGAPSVQIKDTPVPDMMEFWKVKLFVDTGVYAEEGETYRVRFDTWAFDDMDFEVNYNRIPDEGDEEESGYGSVYSLHVPRNKETAIEHIFTASKDGVLRLQIMLGKVRDPNTVSVRNLQVERVTYTHARKSALPAEVEYKAPSAVSYWVHEDYSAAFTGTDSAITANITSAPENGAEPWKIKLFLDTGAALQAGKYYRVTANVSAKSPQDYEICYNNGGIEMGYDSLGGLHLTGGETQTVEKIVSVPAGKTDVNQLMLQFNLGKTNAANTVTVSGVKVEEVPFSYIDAMPKDFSYTAGRTVSLWTNPDCTASLEATGNAAALHVTEVPETGAEVWKVKLLVNTGAVLSAGKTYLVRADLLAAKAQNYEVCFNNEETEKGFDALYNQTIAAGRKTTVEKQISVPAAMTDAGELVLQFSVGSAAANDITVSNVSVQELNFGADSGIPAPDTVVSLSGGPGKLEVAREKLSYKMPESGEATITMAGADLRAGDLYTVTFTARADRDLTGAVTLRTADGGTAVISAPFQLTSKETAYSFTTKDRLDKGGLYDLLWQFDTGENQKSGGAQAEISGITVTSPPETLHIVRGKQTVTVNGKAVSADTYNINGNNYIKLRDLALLLNDTDGQFVVRYNKKNSTISLTTGKPYTPVGGELTAGENQAASCVRSSANVTVNGREVNLKAYNIGRNNFFRLRDLNELLGFQVDYDAANNAAAITSPPTPEAQEKAHAYDLFFLPETDGETQPYVGDTMPFYDNGVYYIYYLKDGGDSYNHSVYVAETKDFVHYTEHDSPVLSASREDVQDNWIGTGSVVKVDGTYYFFYTGFNGSGSQEYREKIMVAKGSSPTSFEKIAGWEITPPAELGQKNDFRDPQAYYDPASKTISLTITASQDGKARILKYTLGKDLQSIKYDGIIFTDPTGAFWNLECSDTFQIGDKWYLTYSGQEDTLWYATANSRFGPYSNAARLEGKLFYAAKHVEDGENSYMVGWARRSNSASSTQEVSGWAGNIAVQKLQQKEDGSLTLVPVESVVSAFEAQKALDMPEVTLKAGSSYSFEKAFTSSERFMLKGEFTYTGTGAFGLAFDFNGKEEQYKLISMDPAANKLRLSFNKGAAQITETQAALHPNQKHSFTYIQDGSVGIFYLDGEAALTVRLYGVTDKPIYLFAENNSVTFTSLRQYTL